VNKAIWIVSAVFAFSAGVTDLRWRRIPNWLTVPAILVAIALHGIAAGWPGARLSLLGTAVGLGLLLPFVLIRSLGAGDWKLVGGLGAFFGTQRLITVLFLTLLINGFIAICMVIWKRRVGRTLRNLGRMAVAVLSLHRPGGELTLDSPEAVKVPFGVAAAVAVLLYTSHQAWGAF
jgi:prepilin peptidase CpaA